MQDKKNPHWPTVLLRVALIGLTEVKICHIHLPHNLVLVNLSLLLVLFQRMLASFDVIGTLKTYIEKINSCGELNICIHNN